MRVFADGMTRYKAGGVAGLIDRPKGRRQEWLTEAEQASLAAVIFKRPKHQRMLRCMKRPSDRPRQDPEPLLPAVDFIGSPVSYWLQRR